MLGFESAALPKDIAAQWDAARNKLLRPTQVGVASTRLAHWTCAACGAEFKRRVRDHVAAQGACPDCGTCPSAAKLTTPATKASSTAAAAPITAMPVYSRDKRTLGPMLAFPWDKYKDRISETDDLFVSKKLDGVRCVAAWDPVAKAPYFMSRAGNVFESADFISADIRSAFERDPSLVLDGELYNHDAADFGEIISAVRVTREFRTPEHERQQQELQFHVFDLMYGKGIDLSTPFSLRLGALERIVDRLSSGTDRIALVESELSSKSLVDEALDAAINDGYEGVMIRHGSAGYEHGKRSASLLKHKRMADAEFTVVDVLEGKGRLEGVAGAIMCVTDGKAPKLFKANIGASDETRLAMWEGRASVIGKRATVQYQELTPSGVPRFGVFKCLRGDASGKGFV
jgi:DNA ligase-1